MFPTTWGPIWEASFRMSSWKYASLWRNCSASSFLIRRVSEHTVSFFALAARKLEAKCQDQSWHLWQHFSSLFFFFLLEQYEPVEWISLSCCKASSCPFGKKMKHIWVSKQWQQQQEGNVVKQGKNWPSVEPCRMLVKSGALGPACLNANLSPTYPLLRTLV